MEVYLFHFGMGTYRPRPYWIKQQFNLFSAISLSLLHNTNKYSLLLLLLYIIFYAHESRMQWFLLILEGIRAWNLNSALALDGSAWHFSGLGYYPEKVSSMVKRTELKRHNDHKKAIMILWMALPLKQLFNFFLIVKSLFHLKYASIFEFEVKSLDLV